MQSFIRFLGVLNAAVWFGAVVFFTVVAGPAFFSGEMAGFLPRPHAARAAEIVVARLVSLQEWCAVIALLHLLVEHLYFGRRSGRLVLGILIGMLAVNVIAGWWLLPKMNGLQRIRYSPQASEVQRAGAKSAFDLWHGLSQLGNLLVMSGVGFHLWNLTRPPAQLRYSR